jgi:hypothetical protein
VSFTRDGADGLANPPCRRCSRAGTDCVIAVSRRGIRRDRVRTADPDVIRSPSCANDSTSLCESSRSHSSRADIINISPLPTGFEVLSNDFEGSQRNSSASAAIDDTFASTNLHNTSDALNLLSQAALGVNHISKSVISQHVPSHDDALTDNFGINESDLLQYHLVVIGVLTPVQVADLVQRYRIISSYYQYF